MGLVEHWPPKNLRYLGHQPLTHFVHGGVENCEFSPAADLGFGEGRFVHSPAGPGGALLQRVRAEPGRQTLSGAFSAYL